MSSGPRGPFWWSRKFTQGCRSLIASRRWRGRREGRPSLSTGEVRRHAANRCRRVLSLRSRPSALVRTRRRHSNRRARDWLREYLKSAYSVAERRRSRVCSDHPAVASPSRRVASRRTSSRLVSRVWHARKRIGGRLPASPTNGGLCSMSRCDVPAERRCSEVVSEKREGRVASSLARSLSLSLSVCLLPAVFLSPVERQRETAPTILGATKFRRQYGTAGRYATDRPNLPI